MCADFTPDAKPRPLRPGGESSTTGLTSNFKFEISHLRFALASGYAQRMVLRQVV